MVRRFNILYRKTRKLTLPLQKEGVNPSDMPTTHRGLAPDRWLTPEQTEALKLCQHGKVIRSNYTADHPKHNGEWQIHWKQLESLRELGLVIRVGKHYSLTDAGYRRLGL